MIHQGWDHSCEQGEVEHAIHQGWDKSSSMLYKHYTSGLGKQQGEGSTN